MNTVHVENIHRSFWFVNTFFGRIRNIKMKMWFMKLPGRILGF